MVEAPVVPLARESRLGAEGAAAVTFNVIACGCDKVPSVLFTINGYDPAPVPAVVTVKSLLPGTVTGFTEKLALAPAGKPVVLSVTLPAYPFCAPKVNDELSLPGLHTLSTVSPVVRV